MSADNATLNCYGDCYMIYIIHMLAVYYGFGIDYPICNAIVMDFLQKIIINEVFLRETSKTYKFFCKKVLPLFDRNKAQDRTCKAINNVLG